MKSMQGKMVGVVLCTVLAAVLFFPVPGALSQEKKTATATTTNRKALCVGINNFKNFTGPDDTLQGCVTDANDMEKLLIRWYGFAPGEITKLTNTQATKANIMQHLKEMVDGAKQGKFNYLVFSLSSHGTQVLDVNGDEPDGLDEAFCPYDLAAAGGFWDPQHIIIDDELHDLFVQLPESVRLEVFLDTCHSGTGIRLANFQRDRKPRLMRQPSREAFDQVEARSREGLVKTRASIDKGITNSILWAACRSDQVSNDAEIAGGWHGAFTYYFCKVINETQNKFSRKEVLKKVRDELKAGGFLSQTPQLE
jgi:hypothetical protein